MREEREEVKFGVEGSLGVKVEEEVEKVGGFMFIVLFEMMDNGDNKSGVEGRCIV